MPQIQENIPVRPPWERMKRIHEQIKGNHYPNCSRIAKEIEDSTRTIKRDIGIPSTESLVAPENSRPSLHLVTASPRESLHILNRFLAPLTFGLPCTRAL